MSEIERELGWDDQIEKDGAEFTLLPEGDYDFEITSFERSRSNGSDKIPACNMAIVQVKIEAPEGTTTIPVRLLLHTKMEWKLCEFFISIGQRKHGEKVSMNWKAVPGSVGRCKVGIKKYEGKDYNEIKKFYEPEEGAATKKFEAGKF